MAILRGGAESEMTSDLDWPLSGNRLMAWVPPGENSLALAAVPVTPEDVANGLSKAEFRKRLAARVLWMIERDDDPEEAIDALREMLEARDLWPGVEVQAESLWGKVAELLTDNPLWPDYLNLQIEFPDERPMPVRPVPAAVRAVQQTTLVEWLDLAFSA